MDFEQPKPRIKPIPGWTRGAEVCHRMFLEWIDETVPNLPIPKECYYSWRILAGHEAPQSIELLGDYDFPEPWSLWEYLIRKRLWFQTEIEIQRIRTRLYRQEPVKKLAAFQRVSDHLIEMRGRHADREAGLTWHVTFGSTPSPGMIKFLDFEGLDCLMDFLHGLEKETFPT
ncbi:MAG: hypothetical protein WCT02_03930 [Candidatus Paceibacterota bacterium]